MRKKYGRLLISVALLVCSVALGRKKPAKPDELGAELRKAPAIANSWQNPYAGQPEAILAGRKLFKRHCTECHGLDGRGQGKAPNLHAPIIQSASAGTLFWFLRNGNLKEGMPSWSRLPDQQLWQLVTYLRTLH